MDKFYFKVEDNKDYPTIIQDANICAEDMASAIKQVKRELGVKRVCKIYLSNENFLMLCYQIKSTPNGLLKFIK